MNWNTSTIENLRRVFTEGFAVRDVAEPLVSFDASTSAAEVLRLMNAEDFDVVGVRRNGLVVGYAQGRFDTTVGPQEYELVLEWAYRVCMRGGAAFFQPDLQYVVNPGGAHQYPNALQVGAQAGINF